MRKIVLLISVILFIVQKHYSNPYKLEHLGVGNGLSNTCVLDITQDKNGFIWFATEEGLNKLNGDKFISYFKGDNCLTGNELNCVMDDPVDSILWIGTQRNGINAYDYARKKFFSYENIYGDTNSLITNSVTDLCPAKDGNFWVSTYWGGLDYFDKKSGRFLHYNRNTVPGLVSDQLWTVFDDNAGKLYLGHVNNGLSILSLHDRTVKNYINDKYNKYSLPGNEVKSIFKDSYGNLWVGTNNGLALFDAYNERFINFSELDSRLGNYIFDIIQKENELWVATDFSGIAILELSQHLLYYPTKTHIDFISNAPDNYSLSSSSIRSLYVDGYSNIWIGFYGGGINFINSENQLFNNYVYLRNDGDIKMLDDPNVLSLSYVNDKLLVGTNSGNLNIITDGRVEHISILGNNNTKVIQSSLCLSNGDILFGLFGGGLKKYDRKSNKVVSLSEGDLDLIDVRSIYEDNKQFVWLSTSNGVYKLDINSYRIIDHYDIANNMIRCVVRDSNGNFFVATFGSGLLIFNGDFQLIKTYEVSTGFTSNTINHLYIDSKDNIWVSTGEGLVKFSPGNYNEYEKFTRDSGLNNIHIRAVVEDNWNNIWLSTNRGISCIKSETNIILNYTEVENVPMSGFNSGAVAKDRNGILYFGSTEGVCFFNPYNVLKEREAPESFISSIVITEGLNVNKAESSIIYPSNEQKIELDDHQNNFSVSLDVMNYALKDQVEYAYILKGFDPSWYTVDNHESLVFRNLPYGEYELIIKSRIRNNEWGKKLKSISIIINPPFWLTWWAKSVYFILVIGFIIYGLYFYKRRLNLLYLYKLEKENHAKEHELNQERLRFYTNITHELRTPLTLIIGPLEDMFHSDSLADKDKKKVELIYNSALRLLNLINQILEFRKTETQNRKLCVSWGDICKTIYEVGLKYKEFNRNKNIDFRIETCCEHVELFFDKEIIIIILDNLISNAFKYTDNGLIKLSLNKKVINKTNYVEIKVSDTGYGISEEALPHIFDRYYQENGVHQASGTGIGLALVKNLTNLHRAEISLVSKVNEGTEFTILLDADYTYPDNLHNDNNALSTINDDLDIVVSDNIEKNEKPILLIIEDNNDIRNYVSESFSEDFEVKTARNGKMGLQMAFDILPDIVISDIMMPEMDGIEVCRSLKNDIRTSHIPIILLTAKNTSHDKEEGYMSGADSYITKPFSASLLRTRIDNILEIRKKLSDKISSEQILKEKKKIILESTTKLDNEFLNKFNNIVESNMSSDKVDVTFISEQLCMSNSTLYRKVKALTGLSTNEYVRKIKMQHAERLLMEQKYTISEIAYMIGMNSSVYFRQCFKEEFGVLPSEYIKKINENL